MGNLYWKFHGIFEDIYYYVTALPRFILYWGEKSPLNLYTFVKWNIKKYPNENAFLFKEEVLTWKQASDKIDNYSGVIRSLGLNKGDSFALLMDNRIEYLLLILAAVKSGTIAALINTTVRGEGLRHVLNVANAKAVFIGASHLDKFNSSLTDEERGNLIIVGIEDQEQVPSNIQDLTNLEKNSTPCDEETTTFKEACMYMYTSGTTGLPKAALITNERAVRMTYFGQFLGFNFKQSDVLYNTLPLYHATGLLYCWAASLRAGNAIVIKEKFSASDFWSDIQKYQATIFPYVGELCRYLLNSKEVPEEKGHKIRRISGNGLRPDIWEKFQERFQIPGLPARHRQHRRHHLQDAVGSTRGRPALSGHGWLLVRRGGLPPTMQSQPGQHHRRQVPDHAAAVRLQTRTCLSSRAHSWHCRQGRTGLVQHRQADAGFAVLVH